MWCALVVLNSTRSRRLAWWSGLCLLAMLLVAVCPSAFAATKKMNVEQLEKLIAANKDKSDKNLAEKLYDIELTEQISETRLAGDRALLPGPLSREALTAIADIAIFLRLPAADLPDDAAPDTAAAKAIFRSGQNYATKLAPKLPNFFATRTITRYMDVPMEQPRKQNEKMIYEALHVAGNSTVTVLYRNGHEVIDAGSASKDGNDKNTRNLSTDSEFGPMLLTVMADSAHGTVTWSHWEKRQGATIAVFDYTVPQMASHYTVDEPWLDKDVIVTPAYHGEIAINPTDGTVLRLSMIAEMGPKELVTKANLLVDYGEVEIGGKKFILPVKSVVLSLVHVQHGGEIDEQGISWTHELWSSLGPPQTRVNDMRFTEYHQFRAESVVVGSEGAPK